jgi:SEC-C motif-containing protein
MALVSEPIGPCPCGRGLPYADCCGPILAGDAPARTAEALMRSRYSAYVVGDAAHLLRTWAPETRPTRVTFDPNRRWTGLTILDVTDGGLLARTGEVEFVAEATNDGEEDDLHERSRFRRDGGAWLYVDGAVLD